MNASTSHNPKAACKALIEAVRACRIFWTESRADAHIQGSSIPSEELPYERLSERCAAILNLFHTPHDLHQLHTLIYNPLTHSLPTQSVSAHPDSLHALQKKHCPLR